MKKTIILSILALVFAFTSTVKADISLSGYTEFFAGSADQSKYQGVDNVSGIDTAGFKNGNYSRITAGYSSTLDNGIDVSGESDNLNGLGLNFGVAYDINNKFFIQIQYDFTKLNVNDVPDIKFNTNVNLMKIGIGFKI